MMAAVRTGFLGKVRPHKYDPPLSAVWGTSPLRILRLTGFILAGALLGVLLAAWQVPRALNWGRYRAAIAAIASARLGRPVAIDGDISLSLLPQAVLTASGVTLADRGDGISAQIGALRLRVDLPSLLHGRIVPHDVALENARLRLPWPLPRDIADPAHARLPKGFSARLDGGILQIGTISLAGLGASLRSDADTGAFAADGVVTGATRNWVFTALLGAPGSDGISTLNLTADGQGAAQDTGGYFRGRMLRSGAIDGIVSARGPDLSQIMTAPRIAWQASGKLTASGLQIGAPNLDITIGTSPGHAALTVDLQEPFGLVGMVSAGQVDLAAWGTALAAAPSPPLRLHVHFAAEAGAVMGGVARNIEATLDADPKGARLTGASAILPGDAAVTLAGDIANGGISGGCTLTAPNPQATLRWLRPTLPGFIGSPPLRRVTEARLAADIVLNRQGLAVQALSGTVNGSGISGSVTLGFGAPASYQADLTMAFLALDPIEHDLVPQAMSLAQGAAEGEARLSADRVTWRGISLTGVKFDARTGPAGLVVKSLSFAAAGGRADIAGTLGADGSLTGLSLSAKAPEAGTVFAALPADWRRFPRLWQGNFDLAANASGKPGAIGTQFRADLGDLRMEADGVLDLAEPQMEATITVRHPGAPRLLAGFGVENAFEWLETGSVALAAHVHARPGHLTVHDFALSAAELQVGGAGEADFNGETPAIDASLHAGRLALPILSAQDQLPFDVLQGWQGHVGLTADSVLLGLLPVATDLVATGIVSGGVLHAAPVTARIGAASLSGELAIDSTSDHPGVALRGTVTGISPGALPGGLSGGVYSLDADLVATGRTWPALLATTAGDLRATVTSADLDGIDLPAMTRLLGAHAAKLRPALQKTLSGGTAHFLSGSAAASVLDGTATMTAARLASPDGVIGMAGDIDLNDRTMDVRLGVSPSLPSPPTLGLRLVGPWQSPRRVVDVAPGLLWAGKGHAAPHASTAGNGP